MVIALVVDIVAKQREEVVKSYGHGPLVMDHPGASWVEHRITHEARQSIDMYEVIPSIPSSL